MATRIWLRLNDATSKCCFSNFKYHRTNLQVHESFKHVRGFKRLKDMQSEMPAVQNDFGLPSLRFWKTFGFTVMFSGSCIVGATIWEYENIRTRTYNLLHRVQERRIIREGLRGEAQKWWRNLTPGERIFIPICFLNVLVYLAWKVPAYNKTMRLFFTSSPASRVVGLPLVLSTFSHEYFWHMFANMYVLHDICNFSVSSLGTEQFLAMYLISGVFGSFLSHLYKVALNRTTASLGASGAVMGVLGYTCCQFPSLEFNIIFLPMITFTSAQALKAVVAIDLVGAIMRWRFIDHAAHLGGVFIGVLWEKWINANIWQKRKPLLMEWHKFREPKRPN